MWQRDLMSCRSAPRGTVRLAVHPGLWSRAVHLDALGLHSSVHVLAPAHPTGPGAARTQAAAFTAAAAASTQVCHCVLHLDRTHLLDRTQLDL